MFFFVKRYVRVKLLLIVNWSVILKLKIIHLQFSTTRKFKLNLYLYLWVQVNLRQYIVYHIYHLTSEINKNTFNYHFLMYLSLTRFDWELNPSPRIRVLFQTFNLRAKYLHFKVLLIPFKIVAIIYQQSFSDHHTLIIVLKTLN